MVCNVALGQRLLSDLAAISLTYQNQQEYHSNISLRFFIITVLHVELRTNNKLFCVLELRIVSRTAFWVYCIYYTNHAVYM